MDHSRLSFHTELGKVLPQGKQNLCKEDYVLLATVQTKHSLRYVYLDLVEDDIKIADQYLRNQTNSLKKKYYETTGKMYSFRYVQIYTPNLLTKHTIEKYVKSQVLLLYSIFTSFNIFS